MAKTPEYTKRAVNNYREKFDFIQVRFPKGTKERLDAFKNDTWNVNDYINKLVLEDLERLEAAQEPRDIVGVIIE